MTKRKRSNRVARAARQFDDAQSVDREIEHYRREVASCRRALGDEVFANPGKAFSQNAKTRPFISAMVLLAGALYLKGEEAAGIELWLEAARLEDADHKPPILELLAPVLANELRFDELLELVNQVGDNAHPCITFSRVLACFAKYGDTQSNRDELRKCIEGNPTVPDLLLDPVKILEQVQKYTSSGSMNPAMAYAFIALDGWRDIPGALQWLQREFAAYREAPAPSRFGFLSKIFR